MRIMGLGDSVHFLSWALISLILNLISVVIISVLLKVRLTHYVKDIAVPERMIPQLIMVNFTKRYNKTKDVKMTCNAHFPVRRHPPVRLLLPPPRLPSALRHGQYSAITAAVHAVHEREYW